MKLQSVVNLAGVVGLVALCFWLTTLSGSPAPPGGIGDAPPATATPAAPAGATAEGSALPPEAIRTLESEDPGSREPLVKVVVIDSQTRQPVSGATVSHVAPGFSLQHLTEEQLDLYSLNTEALLRDIGCSVRCNAAGSAHISQAAAGFAVVAREGGRVGTGAWKFEADVLEIIISPTVEVVIETVDSSGTPVPRVRIAGMSEAHLIFGERSLMPIGTTDEGGRLRYSPVLVAGSAKRCLYAMCLGEKLGPVVVDLQMPPAGPIQIVVPAAGRVRARLLDSSGGLLDPATIVRVRAELSRSPTAPAWKRLTASLDSDGWATFDNVARDTQLSLRFPSVVDCPIPFWGPSAREPVVTVVHHLQRDHPSVVGALVGPERRPLGDVDFALFVQDRDVIAVCGGRTGPDGTFATFLPSSVTGREGATLRFGMERTELRYKREVTITPVGALLQRVDLGVIDVPESR